MRQSADNEKNFSFPHLRKKTDILYAAERIEIMRQSADNEKNFSFLHLQKEKLVEAGGIEPPSASPTQPATTCLVRRLCLAQKRPKNEAKSAPAVYF